MIQIEVAKTPTTLENLRRTAEAISAYQRGLARQIQDSLAPLYRTFAEIARPNWALAKVARQLTESQQRLLSSWRPILQASIELDRIVRPIAARLAQLGTLTQAAIPRFHAFARALENPRTEVGFLHLLWQAHGELNSGRFEKADAAIGLVAGDLIRSPLDREAARLALDRILREGLWDHPWADRPWAAETAGLHGYVRRRIQATIARARQIRLTAPVHLPSFEEIQPKPALPNFTPEVDSRLDLALLPGRPEDTQVALLLSEGFSWHEAARVVAPWVLEDEASFLRWQRATRQRLQRRWKEALRP